MAALVDEVTEEGIKQGTCVALDTTYYQQLERKSTFTAQFLADGIKVTDFQADYKKQFENIRLVFDTAVCLSAIKELPKGDIYNLLHYYSKKGTISPEIDFTVFNKMDEYDKNQVIVALRKEKIEKLSSIAELFSELCEAQIEDSSSGSSGGGRGSTGGGYVPVAPAEKAPKPPETMPAVTERIPFSDVSEKDWTTESIFYLYRAGIISGDGNGKFRPKEKVTRSEFVKMAAKAFSLELTDDETTFCDVEKEAWYYPYIVSAYHAGWIRGISEEQFGVDEEIRREDMAVILSRIAGLADVLPQADRINYEDINEISSYAEKAVGAMTQAGILNGDGNRFYPKRSVTREESCKVIYACLMQMEGR